MFLIDNVTVCRLRDKEPPRHSPKPIKSGSDREKPYLGLELPLHWPPPLVSNSPDLPSYLKAENAYLNYYVLPQDRVSVAVGNGSSSSTNLSAFSSDNKVNLNFGMTAAEVLAHEQQHLTNKNRNVASHLQNLITEEFLLNKSFPNSVTSVARVSGDHVSDTTSSTDKKLAEAINTNSWRGTMDLFPTSQQVMSMTNINYTVTKYLI